MKKTRMVQWQAALMVMTLGAGAVAHASASRSGELFGMSSERPTAEVQKAVEQMQRDCTYSEFSRIGPRPAEVARCNRAEGKAVALGAPAARWALHRIDGGMETFRSWRLYDLVARVGDLSLVEPLLHGLEQLTARSDSPRTSERRSITTALQTLTYAELTIDAEPAAWRAWVDAHRGLARAQLLAERVATARVQVNGVDRQPALTAARFLAAEPTTLSEGAAALQTVLRRADLTVGERRGLEYVLGRLPKELKNAPATPVAANQAPTS